MTFRRAIVRIPGENFAKGESSGLFGVPDYQLALAQHQKYCEALQKCGLELITLPADLRFPDSTFVEDTAILTPGCAIITNPGAASRKGEEVEIKAVVAKFYEKIYTITAPGTLDGGDICEAGGHFFIGLSERTNEAGARQLASFLSMEGYTASCINVKGIEGLLHLKSGIAYLGDNNLVAIDPVANRDEFKGYNIIHVSPEENYAANCLRINDYVFLPEGFPILEKTIGRLGYQVLTLNMSEFRKMDGGLSCLSLRF
jgi:dimethylargininase